MRIDERVRAQDGGSPGAAQIVHRVDIVHRDIKPANVMLVDGGLVKTSASPSCAARAPCRA